ncbi:MAG: hypothetical protein ACFCBU_00835 [Cyanophyceae cyanobacterium]
MRFLPGDRSPSKFPAVYPYSKVALEFKTIQLEAEPLEALTAVEKIEEAIEAVKASVYTLPIDENSRVMELQGAITRMGQLG